MNYNPGLHILAEIKSDDISLFSHHEKTKVLFDELIQKFDLSKLGDFYHDFDGGGFTGVVCLTESHISIHTWPEYKLCTFDVFLSNYQKINDEKAREILKEVVAFFKSTQYEFKEVKR